MKNLFCPKCGQKDKLYLRVPTWLSMTDDGTDLLDSSLPSYDVEWDHTSRTICPACKYQGLAVNFYEDTQGWFHPAGFILHHLQYDLRIPGHDLFTNCLPMSNSGTGFIRQSLPMPLFVSRNERVLVRPSLFQHSIEAVEAFTINPKEPGDVTIEMVELSTCQFFRVGAVIYEEYLPLLDPLTWTRRRCWHESQISNVAVK